MPERTKEIRDSQHEMSRMESDGQVVVFRLANEEFGLDINNVKEIVRLPDITPIPRSPDYVAGICNLRGNVLPVINTRKRFSMETNPSTDHTRLLVVDMNGVQTSLIVDSVREVMRLTDAYFESPPQVCRGADRQFLKGVIKVNNGNRLILMLNINEVLSIDQNGTPETPSSSDITSESFAQQEVSEEQLVSFKLANDEYAFEISKVREILKVTDLTSVPNVPEYVKGLFTIRNHLLPIIDLRLLLGMDDFLSEKQEYLDKGIEEDCSWLERLNHIVESESYFSGNLDAKDTPFGKFLEEYKTTSVEIEGIIKRIKKARSKLYSSGQQVLEQLARDRTSAISQLNTELPMLLTIVKDTVSTLKERLTKQICEDQRALVIEIQGMTVGFLVDWVDEVIRVPRSVIDETPFIASSDRKELKAVAKLNHGDRLIMIMDETALVSSETSKMISDLKKKEEAPDKMEVAEKKSLAQQSLDEEQLVTFSIDKEEYGIRIMQVQEINRAIEITSVPRAPVFVDGMTNLRGSVIPVINIRSLFGLEDREIDDHTRIIIVDIHNKRTGLRVDKVNEVLRLSKQDIVQTPKIVIADGLNKYMEGVCKIDGGKRMVVLLNIEKILDENELKAFNAFVEPSSQPKKVKRDSNKSKSNSKKTGR